MIITKYKYLEELLFCTLGSAIGGWIIAELSWRILKLGDRYDMLNGIFVGMPLSCILVLLILRKFVYKEKRIFSIVSLILGLILSLIAEILCIFLVGVLGNIIFIIIPIVVSMAFILSDRILQRK